MQLYYVNLREGISIYKILWFIKNETVFLGCKILNK